MDEKLIKIEIEDIPDELWQKIVTTKEELAPQITMDEWMTWLVKEGIDIHHQNQKQCE